MLSRRSTCLVVSAFLTSLGGIAALAAAAEDRSHPFPSASPDSVGLSAEALELLASHVQELTGKNEVVGAELHVIKDRHTVLHRAFGHADREQDRALEVDAIHCVRSMTKPLTGTAIQMLLDEGRLQLDTKVASILPPFDTPGLKNATIEHLLTHTCGFPFSTITRPVSSYSSLLDVATEAAEHGPTFRPGAGFQYSDAGTDSLGAVIEQLTGRTAAEYIQERILDPLGMTDSITLLDPDDPRTRRIPSAYSGGPGNWTRHWSPTDEPIFSLFLTSQSLYASTTDYARFLTLWLDRGFIGEDRLLSEEAVQRALEPGEVLEGYESGLPGMEVTYGQQWMLYHSEAKADLDPLVFGHNGSDGTYAWAWPEEDLIVLLFTQSRGSAVGVQLEDELNLLLLEQDVVTYRARRRAEAESAAQLSRLAGLYWDEGSDRAYYVVTQRQGRLVVERPGRFRKEFPVSDEPGEFGTGPGSELSLFFDVPDEGPATAMLMKFSTRGQELQRRHQPADDLPDPIELAARVRKAHGMDRLAEIGAIHLQGRMSGKVTGDVDMSYDATRMSYVMSGTVNSKLFIDGEQVVQSTQGGPFTRLDGVSREQAVLDHPSVVYGGWAEHFRSVEVLKRIQDESGPKLLVRTVPREGAGSTMIIDEESGLVIGEDRLSFIPGMGYVGVQIAYEDYRDVAGVQRPFRVRMRYATSLIGEIKMEYDRFETGEEALSHLVREEG